MSPRVCSIHEATSDSIDVGEWLYRTISRSASIPVSVAICRGHTVDSSRSPNITSTQNPGFQSAHQGYCNATTPVSTSSGISTCCAGRESKEIGRLAKGWCRAGCNGRQRIRGGGADAPSIVYCKRHMRGNAITVKCRDSECHISSHRNGPTTTDNTGGRVDGEITGPPSCFNVVTDSVGGSYGSNCLTSGAVTLRESVNGLSKHRWGIVKITIGVQAGAVECETSKEAAADDTGGSAVHGYRYCRGQRATTGGGGGYGDVVCSGR